MCLKQIFFCGVRRRKVLKAVLGQGGENGTNAIMIRNINSNLIYPKFRAIWILNQEFSKELEVRVLQSLISFQRA